MTPSPSPNFAFLAYHDARLVALGTQAEERFPTDPTVTLFKLRQFTGAGLIEPPSGYCENGADQDRLAADRRLP